MKRKKTTVWSLYFGSPSGGIDSCCDAYLYSCPAWCAAISVLPRRLPPGSCPSVYFRAPERANIRSINHWTRPVCCDFIAPQTPPARISSLAVCPHLLCISSWLKYSRCPGVCSGKSPRRPPRISGHGCSLLAAPCGGSGAGAGGYPYV